MEKYVKFFVGVLILIAVTGTTVAFFISRASATDSARIGEYQQRERDLLARIGEYQQREETRIRREAERIAAERERIERTENAIRALRESDRRTSSLLQELTKEINILADFFNDTRDKLNNHSNNMEGE